MLAGEIVAAVARPYLLAGREVRIAAHVGYAIDVQQGADLHRLLKEAGDAAHRACRENRDVIEYGRPRWTAGRSVALGIGQFHPARQ
jgi:GGDEF domain-containing protein